MGPPAPLLTIREPERMNMKRNVATIILGLIGIEAQEFSF